MSVIGQQNLQKSQNALQTSMERLSSGLRINSAKDGISIAQTAEGSLNQINDNVQRIRELSVQSDLNSIQDEINQRLNEIDFNGTKVLAEGVEPMTIQVGANDGETIQINLKGINRESLGLEGFRVADADITATDVSGTGAFGNFIETASGFYASCFYYPSGYRSCWYCCN